MKKIKLLLLEGCKRCEKLKEELVKNHIYYDFQICKSDTEICDSVEEAIGCSNYPIVLKIINTNYIEEINYITDNYEEVGKSRTLNNRVKLNSFYSVDKLAEYIIND